MKTVRFLIFGGFLGSGKTTVIRKYVEFLRERGVAVAVVTNDQAAGLVDTELMVDAGFPCSEISGGCFCCRSDLLM